MDDLRVDIEFLINNPEVKAAADKVKADILGVGATAEKTAARVAASLKKIDMGDSVKEIETYKKSLQGIGGTRVATNGTNEFIHTLDKDLKNGVITARQYQAELARIASLKPASLVNNTPTAGNQLGLLEKQKAKLEELKVSQDQTTNTSRLAIYNAKIEAITAEIKRLTNVGKIGFDDMGNALSRSLDRPAGKLERLTVAQKMYAQAAATSANPDIISKYNRKLQETEAQINQTKNVGKKGFDEMGNAIKGSTNLAGKAYSTLKTLSYMLPGIGIAGIIGFAVGPIIEFIGKLDLFKKKLSESQKEAKALGESLASSDYTKAVTGLNELKTNLDLAKRGMYDKKAVVNEYNKSIGEVAGQVKTLSEVEQGLIDNAEDYVKMTLYKAAAQLSLEEAAKLAVEAEQKQLNNAEDVVGFWGKRAAEFKVIANNVSSKFGGEKEYEIYNRSLETQKEKEIRLIKEKEEEKLNIAKKFQNDAAELAKNMGGVLGLDTGSKTPGQKSDPYQSAIAKRQSVLDSLSKLTDDFNRKAQSKEDEARLAIVDRFGEMRKQLIAYNAWATNYNKSNKGQDIGLIDIGGLKPVEEAALNNLKGQQAVEAYKLEIDQQKQLFEQFERYKIDFGAEKAAERYGNDLKGFKTYIEYLNSLMPDSKDQSAKANALRDLLNKDLIPKANKEASDREFDENAKNLKRILEATKTAKTEELRINGQYDKDLATARKNLAGDELAGREASLAKQHQVELNGIREMAFEETRIAQEMAENLFYKTREQLKEHVQKLKKELRENDNLADGDAKKLTPAQRKEVSGSVKEADQLYKSTSKTAKVSGEIANYSGQAADAFKSLGSALESSNPELAYTVGQIGEVLSIVSDVGSKIASGDYVGAAVSAITGVLTMSAKVKEMNAKARAEVAKFYETARLGELGYQSQLRERQLIRINALTTQGLRDEQSALKKQQDLLNKQAAAKLAQLQGGNQVASQDYRHGTWFRKAETTKNYESLAGSTYEMLQQLDAQGKLQDSEKGLFEELKKLKEELVAVGEASESTKQATKELVTGTNVDSLASNIISSLVSGKTGLSDVMDDYQNIIKDALMSSFEADVVKQELKGFYERLATAGGDSDGLTKTEIELAKTDYLETRKRIQEQYDNLGKVTGVELTDKNSSGSGNAMVGAIQKTVSEETGSLIVGQFGGMRLAQLETNVIGRANGQTMMEQLGVMRSQFLVIVDIEINTRRLHEMVPILTAIKVAAEKNSGLAAANGRGI